MLGFVRLGKELLRIAGIARHRRVLETHTKTFNAEEKRKQRNWRHYKRKTTGIGQPRQNPF
jgi:hypothetical protein